MKVTEYDNSERVGARSCAIGAIAFVLWLRLAINPAAGAELTWDSDTVSAGAQDGGGTWNTSDPNWWNAGGYVWPNTTSDSAIIGAASGAAGSITVSGTITLNCITFNTPGSGTYTLSGGTLLFGGTTPTLTANADAAISSMINASGDLTKNGSGALSLSGSNTYSGNITVGTGALRVKHNNALGSTNGSTTVAAGANLEFDGSASNLTVGEAITVNYTSGAIRNMAGNNVISGLLTLNDSSDFRRDGGTMTFSGGIAGSNKTLSFNGPFSVTNRPVSIGNGSLTFTSNNNGSNQSEINVAGNTWGLSRINFGGYVMLGADDAFPTNTDLEFGWHLQSTSSGTLNLNGHNQTVGSIAVSSIYPGLGGDQNITGTSGTLTINQVSGTKEYQGRFTGGISIVKRGAGTLILNNLSGINSTFTGSTAVNGGTLKIVGQHSSNSSFSVASGALLDLNGSNVVCGGIGGAGLVTNGALAVNGAIVPGDTNCVGALTTESQSWSANASYNWEVKDAKGAAGTGYDTLAINGTLNLSAVSNCVIRVITLNGDTPGPAANVGRERPYTWTLATASSAITGFSPDKFTINTNQVISGIAGNYTVQTNGNSLELHFVAIPIGTVMVIR